MTLEDTRNAISSPESADGRLRCAWQDGQTLDLFGQAVAPASRSAPPERKPGNQMSATYGRIGIGSSESQSLQSYLESRLHQRLPLAGLMTLPLIWKRKATPSRRRYCQLALQGRSTEETDCGLWQTPTVGGGGQTLPEGTTFTGKMPDGKKRTVCLERQIKMLWPTPKASDGEKGGPNQRGSKGDLALPAQAHHAALWMTPRAQESGEKSETFLKRMGDRSENCYSSLTAQAKAIWGTPSARDWKDSQGMTKIAGGGAG